MMPRTGETKLPQQLKTPGTFWKEDPRKPLNDILEA
jgi:hypothetical protein